jgi:RIO-like serine/threonine protein kinase
VTLLKRDLFGTIQRVNLPDHTFVVVRDTGDARTGLRWFARYLARREARALERLAGIEGIPRLLAFNGRQLTREWIEAEPMQRAKPASAHYFHEAFALLRKIHARDALHNDLAKESNWLVTADGRPALVDFQLASHSRRRGKLFRLLAHDDVRHLLKHKRSYIPDRLTARERRILATPSILSRLWKGTGKRLYLLVTRRILGWSDREGAGDRLHDSRQTR